MKTECVAKIKNHRNDWWDFQCPYCRKWVKNISPYGGSNYVEEHLNISRETDYYRYVCENCSSYNEKGEQIFGKNINKTKKRK